MSRLGARVTAVAWVSDHLEVEVAQPADLGSVVFQLERRRPGRPCFLSLGEMDLYYRGSDLDPNVDLAVRKVAPRALGGLPLERLAELVAEDPDAGRPTEPVPRPDAADQADYDDHAMLSTWGGDEGWSTFFAGAEVARSQLDSLDFFERCAFVQHCDQECLCVNPQTGVPMVPVVLYPWDDRLRRIAWGDEWSGPTRDEESPGMVTTDLSELDVIMGRGPEKLSAVLDDLAGRVKGEMAFCSCTCVPVVAGEDVESVVDRHRGDFEVPLLFLTTTPQSMQGVFRDLLVRRRLAAESRTGPCQSPRRYNLLGFPLDPATQELVGVLSELGAELNVALLPALSPALIDRFPEASLTVIHPNELWRGHYDQLQFDSRVAAVEPAAPFGVAGTRRWVEAVAEALGITGDVSRAVSRALEPHRASWEALTTEARRHRLGFVVRSTEQHLLTDPAKSWGIPLLAVVEEMGFAVDVLVATEEELEPRDVEALRRWLGPDERHRIRPVSSPKELSAALGAGDVSSVYSEHFYDRRLSEHGVSSFSSQELERGFGGALRSLERLVQACATPFQARYGRYLREAAALASPAEALGPPEGGTE